MSRPEVETLPPRGRSARHKGTQLPSEATSEATPPHCIPFVRTPRAPGRVGGREGPEGRPRPGGRPRSSFYFSLALPPARPGPVSLPPPYWSGWPPPPQTFWGGVRKQRERPGGGRGTRGGNTGGGAGTTRTSTTPPWTLTPLPLAMLGEVEWEAPGGSVEGETAGEGRPRPPRSHIWFRLRGRGRTRFENEMPGES